MAGGKGTRLKPLTCGIPKPMVPILNKPTMEYTIELLKSHDIKEVAVTIAHLPTCITDYFDTGDKWDVHLHYYQEEVPLGTGGSVKNAEDFIDDTFIVLSGDALTDINLKEAIAFHKNKGSKATLILKNEAFPIEYGVVITNKDGKITRFLEKPSWGEVFSNTINTGMYILEPEVLDYFQRGENFDFSKDLFPRLLADDVPMYGYVTEDYWCDVGALKSYMQTHFDILEGKVKVKIDGYQMEKGIWVGEGTEISKDVLLTPPLYIGKNCIIGEGSKIDAYTVLGDYCHVGKDVSLKRSIVWNNTFFSQKVHCSGGVICNNVKISKDVEIYENAVIGDDCRIEDKVIIKPDMKIWPDKRIEENTVVNQNLVWGTKASKTIFGFKDITGKVNIDITPEFASRLGAAFASSLKEEAAIVVSSDSSNACRMIKYGFITGIASIGVGVIDIGEAIMPMNRFAVTHFKGGGGVHIRRDYTDQNLLHIEFTGKNGINIPRGTEREIENLLNRDEFKRCNGKDIQSPLKIDNFQEFYINHGLTLLVDLCGMKRKAYSLVIASKSHAIQKLTKEFLERSGCQVAGDYRIEEYEDMTEYLPIMVKEVKKRKANLGVIISEDGERLILVDKSGQIIQQEKYDMLVVIMLLKEGYKGEIALPYTAPYSIEKIARQQSVKILRTKSNPASIMGAMHSLGKEGTKGLSQYILSYNAVWGIGMIVDFLVRNDLTLQDLIKEMPKFYFIKEKIPCHWQDKGRILRQLVEEHQHHNIELYEGVKINDEKGWTLILPDSEKPLFNIYTEGFSEEYAQELSLFYQDKVKNLLKSQG